MAMPRAAKSALRVILALAAVLAVGWLVAWPLYDDELPRVQANEGIADASPVMDSIAGFYADHHRLPAPGDMAGYGFDSRPHVRDAHVTPDSRIVVTYKGRHEIDGKQLILTPEVDAKGGLEWRCTLPDIEARWWPDFCRPKTTP